MRVKGKEDSRWGFCDRLWQVIPVAVRMGPWMGVGQGVVSDVVGGRQKQPAFQARARLEARVSAHLTLHSSSP